MTLVVGQGEAKPLEWEPFKVDQANNARKERVERPVPAEYSFLVLARVKEGEGFRDLTTYADMRAHHDKVVTSPDWHDHHRYYSVRVPDALLHLCGKNTTCGNRTRITAANGSFDLTREGI